MRIPSNFTMAIKEDLFNTSRLDSEDKKYINKRTSWQYIPVNSIHWPKFFLIPIGGV